jgi:alanine dehydrogenase
MTTAPIYLTEADVGRLVTVKDAIATLEELFATWGQPSTVNLPRQRARLPGGAFNQMRTGAASGLATKLMANPDAHTLAVIGTGRQSRTQVEAVCAVRPIKRIRVFARTPEHRESYARALEKDLGVEALPATSAEACVADANVVITITKPVCRAAWLARGAHVNAAGANSGDRREVDGEMVLRAAVKATDHIEQAKVEAGEFRDLVAEGKLAWSDIRELGDFVTGKAKGRASPSDLTLFKSLGIALEDMAFGELVYQRARAQGVGKPIPV